MLQSSTLTLDYVECPRCGTRFVLRDRKRAAEAGGRARWFSCARCNKRVRSAAAPRPAETGTAP